MLLLLVKRILSRGWVAGVLLLVASTSISAPAIIPAPPQIAAEGYLLIDAATGKSLVDFNSEQRLPPASLTKLMTSYVAAQELARGTISLDDEVRISKKAWRMKGSLMFIKVDTEVRLEDLLRGMIIQSGNDASVAIAEHIAGTEDQFATLMNQYAERLGMVNTNFENSTGWPDDNHYSTAKDLSKLTVAMIRDFPSHYKMYSELSYEYANIKQDNRNLLLRRDSTVDGVKTGHTEAAGYCLIASAVRDDMRLISVVMGANSKESRAAESQKLLTYGFRYFETVSLYRADEMLRQVRVWGGKHSSVKLGIAEDVVLTIARGSRDELAAEINLQNEIHAPIAPGDELGTLKLAIADGEELIVPVQALAGVQEAGFFASLWDSLVLFFLKIFGGDPLAFDA